MISSTMIFTFAALLSTTVQIGDTPADLVGRDAAHHEIRLGDYRGKIVVIDFWASWCSPCLKELTVLDSIQKQVSKDHLIVLAVNYGEGTHRFAQVAKLFGDNTHLMLVGDPNGAIGKPYGIKSIPFVVVIGRDGKVFDIRHGYSESEIPKFIEELNGLLQADTAAVSPAAAAP